jgi:hypothetical protein
LCGEVFLYFILRIEVAEIRIRIEFKLVCKLWKDWKKKEDFLTQLEAEPGPASRSFFPHPSSIPVWPSRTGPACPASPARAARVRSNKPAMQPS